MCWELDSLCRNLSHKHVNSKPRRHFASSFYWDLLLPWLRMSLLLQNILRMVASGHSLGSLDLALNSLHSRLSGGAWEGCPHLPARRTKMRAGCRWRRALRVWLPSSIMPTHTATTAQLLLAALLPEARLRVCRRAWHGLASSFKCARAGSSAAKVRPTPSLSPQ